MAVSSVCSCSSHSFTTPAPSILLRPAFFSSSSSSSLASSSSASFCGGQVLRSKTILSSSSSVLVADALGDGRRRRNDRKFAFRVSASNVGEWGARDPTAAEIESNFGENVIGNEGTEHIKLIPPSLLGLSERRCTPLPPGTVPLSHEEATALLRKVIGWRLAKTDNGLKIWTEWKLKDSESGITLFDRIAAVAEAEEHYPELDLQDGNTARAELSTQSIGGLSMNDFIFAAKVDSIKTSDLVKKNRFWA